MSAWYGIYSTDNPFDLVWLHTINFTIDVYAVSFWKFMSGCTIAQF